MTLRLVHSLTCPSCDVLIGSGHLPTCEYVEDVMRWFLTAGGIELPRRHISLEDWQRMVEG